MKKLLIFFAFFTTIFLSNCTENSSENKQTEVSEEIVPGKLIYTNNCRLCHGTDGSLGLSGSANLKISALNATEIYQVVSEGRKAMPGWKDRLTPEQMKEVSEYVITLQK